MNKTSCVKALIVITVVVCFLASMFFFNKRPFFSEMGKEKVFEKDVYFKISKYPSYVFPFYLGYKYEFKVKTVVLEGYLNYKDSLIFHVEPKRLKLNKFDLFNFKLERNVVYGRFVPRFKLVDKYSDFYYFLLEPTLLMEKGTIKYIIFKMSVQKGIVGGAIIKDNGVINFFGKYSIDLLADKRVLGNVTDLW